MTPQERQLVSDLFDRLETLESERRDPDAERFIAEASQRAPNAIYALVQTVLVQDEALRAADEQIRALSGDTGAPAQGGFLDTMRDTFFGRRDGARGSVPSVRPDGMGSSSVWGGGAQAGPGYAQQPGYAPQGGSFLGTAAASAAGVIGGALLLNSFRSMFGGQHHSSLMDGGGGRSPWGGDSNLSGSDMARDAGVNDIGRNDRFASNDGGQDRAGFFDTANADYDSSDDDGDSDFGFDDSDSDTA